MHTYITRNLIKYINKWPYSRISGTIHFQPAHYSTRNGKYVIYSFNLPALSSQGMLYMDYRFYFCFCNKRYVRGLG